MFIILKTSQLYIYIYKYILITKENISNGIFQIVIVPYTPQFKQTLCSIHNTYIY